MHRCKNPVETLHFQSSQPEYTPNEKKKKKWNTKKVSGKDQGSNQAKGP